MCEREKVREINIHIPSWSVCVCVCVCVCVSVCLSVHSSAVFMYVRMRDTHARTHAHTHTQDVKFEFCRSITEGGSIRASSKSTLRVMDCTFECSESRLDGGAVAIIGANAEVSTSSFRRCAAGGKGGALWAVGLQTYDVLEPWVLPVLHIHTECAFDKNSAVAMGGAVACIQQANCTMENSTFTDNKAAAAAASLLASGAVVSPQLGGAAAIDRSSFGNISGCHFTQNSADLGGAMSISEASNATVAACRFSGNTATDEDGEGSGGALIATSQSTVSVQNSHFVRNSAQGLGGGAMSVSCIACPSGAVTDVSLFANTFEGNSAPKGGGGAVMWNNSAQSLRVRRACDPGHYAQQASDGRAYCTACPPGTYKETVTAKSCTPCEAGKFSNVARATSSSTCTPCQAGKFEENSRSTSCTSCFKYRQEIGETLLDQQDNFFSPDGSASASDCVCNPGYSGNVLVGCQACPAGKYTACADKSPSELGLTGLDENLCAVLAGMSGTRLQQECINYRDNQGMPEDLCCICLESFSTTAQDNKGAFATCPLLGVFADAHCKESTCATGLREDSPITPWLGNLDEFLLEFDDNYWLVINGKDWSGEAKTLALAAKSGFDTTFAQRLSEDWNLDEVCFEWVFGAASRAEWSSLCYLAYDPLTSTCARGLDDFRGPSLWFVDFCSKFISELRLIESRETVLQDANPTCSCSEGICSGCPDGMACMAEDGSGVCYWPDDDSDAAGKETFTCSCSEEGCSGCPDGYTCESASGVCYVPDQGDAAGKETFTCSCSEEGCSGCPDGYTCEPDSGVCYDASSGEDGGGGKRRLLSLSRRANLPGNHQRTAGSSTADGEGQRARRSYASGGRRLLSTATVTMKTINCTDCEAGKYSTAD